MKKYLFITVLSFVAILTTMTTIVSAEEHDIKGEQDYIIHPDTGEKIVSVYETTENGLKEVSLEEFENALKLQQENENKIELNLLKSLPSTNNQELAAYANSVFVEKKHYYPWYGDSYAVINPMLCPSKSAGCSQTYSVSATESDSFSVNVGTQYDDKVIAGASFSWVYSESVNQSYTLDLYPGQAGEIRFTPKFNRTVGTLRHYTYGGLVYTENAWGMSPARLKNGMLEGFFYGVVW